MLVSKWVNNSAAGTLKWHPRWKKDEIKSKHVGKTDNQLWVG